MRPPLPKSLGFPRVAHASTFARTDLLADLNYTPSVARKRPTSLQALLRIPPHTTARLLLAYETASLWYTEYPSDANRGFSVPGASLTLLSPLSPHAALSSPPLRPGDERFLTARPPRLRLNTPTTLVSLPTPDFSMPYNVIILTSTVIALYFGSVLNGMVRTWWIVDVAPRAEDKVKGE